MGNLCTTHTTLTHTSPPPPPIHTPSLPVEVFNEYLEEVDIVWRQLMNELPQSLHTLVRVSDFWEEEEGGRMKGGGKG